MASLRRARPLLGLFLSVAACGGGPSGDAGPADGAVFDGAVFDGAVFDGAVFDGAVFDGAVAVDAAGALDAGRADGGVARDAGGPDAGPTCAPRARGLWVWQDEVATDPDAREALFALTEARDIGVAFVESEALLARDDDAIAAFVAAARARCLEVDLLLGNPAWARPAQHALLVDLVRRALALDSGARAVHLDVEPYALAEWTDDRDAIARSFLAMLAAVRAELDGGALELVVDIPFWFDEVVIDARPLSERVQEIADRTVILAYRDHAAPPDGIEDHAAAELAFASSLGRPLTVAVETTCGLDPEKVTFCEEGAAALEAELAAAAAAFAGETGFGGFAIHDAAAYRALLGL